MIDFSTARYTHPVAGAFFLAIGICGIEAGLSYALFNEWIGLAVFAAAHIAFTGLIGLWPLWVSAREGDLTFPLLGLILTGFVGVWGAGLFVFTLTLYSIFARRATSFAEWYGSLFPEDTLNPHTVYERLQSGWDDFSEKNTVVPYMDVMTLGTDQQKRIALEKITRFFKPELAPVLIKALEDKSNAIRVQAASILAKFEHVFSSRSLKLEKKFQKQPENTKLIFQLARHYDRYAHTGFVLDPEREIYLREKAIGLYEQYLFKSGEENLNVIFYLGSLYLEDNRMKDAYPLLAFCVDEMEPVPPRVLWHFMECLYRMKHYHELRIVAKRHHPTLNPDSPDAFKTMEMIRFWGGGIIEPNRAEESHAHAT